MDRFNINQLHNLFQTKLSTLNTTPPYIIMYIIAFLYIYILTMFGKSVLLTKNVFIQLSIWVITIFTSIKLNNNYILFAPLIIFLINELVYFKYGHDIYDGVSRTETLYNIGYLHFNKKNKGTTNLTEGVYLNPNGTLMSIEESKKLDPSKAEESRFIEIFKDLNIHHLSKNELKNLSIIDMGCGLGNFVKYCLSRGVNCIGVTISKEQQIQLLNRNLPVIHGDYRDLHTSLIEKADIITFIGSLEHITTGIPCHKDTLERQYTNWETILNNCKQYFKSASNYKKIFGTNLHFNPNVCNTKEAYLLERAYGGAYFYDREGDRLPDISKKHGFNILNSRDMTYHYYMASVADPNHFGNPAPVTLERLIGLIVSIFINPHLFNMIIYGYLGIWMWQFDGKLHYNRDNLGFERDRTKRPTTLWFWTIQQKN